MIMTTYIGQTFKKETRFQGVASAHKQSGATLIEVLIAFLVLSLGMLGMASLQTRAMQFNLSSYYVSQANILAEDILDRMRATNLNNATIGNFLHGMNDSIPKTYTSCYASACTPAQLAQYELYEWLKNVAAILPNGKAQIAENTAGAVPFYIVTIQYDDARVEQSSNYGQNNTIPSKQFSYRTEL
jgi:type IV pilus assembly protein PilV